MVTTINTRRQRFNFTRRKFTEAMSGEEWRSSMAAYQKEVRRLQKTGVLKETWLIVWRVYRYDESWVDVGCTEALTPEDAIRRACDDFWFHHALRLSVDGDAEYSERDEREFNRVLDMLRAGNKVFIDGDEFTVEPNSKSDIFVRYSLIDEAFRNEESDEDYQARWKELLKHKTNGWQRPKK